MQRRHGTRLDVHLPDKHMGVPIWVSPITRFIHYPPVDHLRWRTPKHSDPLDCNISRNSEIYLGQCATRWRCMCITQIVCARKRVHHWLLCRITTKLSHIVKELCFNERNAWASNHTNPLLSFFPKHSKKVIGALTEIYPVITLYNITPQWTTTPRDTVGVGRRRIGFLYTVL